MSAPSTLVEGLVTEAMCHSRQLAEACRPGELAVTHAVHDLLIFSAASLTSFAAKDLLSMLN
ncbi:MAG: hypothetical protein NVSMB6_01370 [Burkholderiaceae bacterium]